MSKSGNKKFDFSTDAIHYGYETEDAMGALTPPLYLTSAYTFKNVEKGQELFNDIKAGFRYGRYANPTQDILERRLAKLESGETALAFASGMGAIAAVAWTLLEKDDEIIVDQTLYGATHSLFIKGLKKFGVRITSVDLTEVKNLTDKITSNTKMVYFETPGNPNLQIIDIRKISSLAKKSGAITVVDNTFASPALQTPIPLGADLVIHSATKYLGGHGDLIAGAVIGRQEMVDKIRAEGLRFYTGATISPLSSFLILRGLKTLSLRMERHSNSAVKIAKFLQSHDCILSVTYPGLENSYRHDIAKKQMKKFSGIISFELSGGITAAVKFMNKLQLIKRAVSLGDTETLIQHPASMTHSTYGSEELKEHNISDRMIRLSVGLEEPDDIIEDIKQALD